MSCLQCHAMSCHTNLARAEAHGAALAYEALGQPRDGRERLVRDLDLQTRHVTSCTVL